MTNIEIQIEEKRSSFIHNHSKLPELLYLGTTAKEALFNVLHESFYKEKLEGKPYMGMTIMEVVNSPTHINVA